MFAAGEAENSVLSVNLNVPAVGEDENLELSS